MTDAGGSGPPPEQLRETLKKKTVPDLIEICKATGISGYSNKRKEELIDLLVFKNPRLDEQVAEESTGSEEPSVRLRLLAVSAMKLCAMTMQCCLSMPLCSGLEPSFRYPFNGSQRACLLLGVIAMNPTGRLDKR
jgi:hypothetical protein